MFGGERVPWRVHARATRQGGWGWHGARTKTERHNRKHEISIAAPAPASLVLSRSPSADGLPRVARARSPSADGMLVSDIFVASLLAEMTRKAILHPVDTMATRLQYDRAQNIVRNDYGDAQRLYAKRGYSSTGEIQAIAGMLRNKPLSLYRGLSTSMVGAVPVSCVYMPTYEGMKLAVQALPASSTLGVALPASQVASVATGLVCAFVRVPISVVKQRIQLGLSSSPLAAINLAVKDVGIRGLFVGLRATCVLDVAYALAQFSALEQLRSIAAVLTGGRALTSAEDAMVGFLTGTITAILTEPLDVVRTRLQTQKGAGNTRGANFGYTGLVDGLQKAAKQEGLMALWRGLLPRLILKSLGSSIWYAAYMATRKALAAGGL